jgi:single-stranded DNA-binding protein
MARHVFCGDLAERALNCDKGDNVSIHGTIDQRQYTASDKSTRTVNEVTVRTFHRVGSLSEKDLAKELVAVPEGPKNENDQHAAPEPSDQQWPL